jgi:hypothetical protein
MSNELKLGIDMDRAPAMAEAQKLRGDLRLLNEKILDDAEVAAEAEKELIRRTNEEKIRQAVAAANREKAIEQVKVDDWKTLRQQMVADERAVREELNRSVRTASQETRDDLEKTGKSGKTSMFDIATGAGVALAGMRMLIGGARDLKNDLEQAAMKQRELTKGLAGSRESNRELMALEGETDDNAFALKLRSFARSSRMTEAEAREFRKGALETGAIGKETLGAKAFEGFTANAAALAPAVGLASGEAGQMAGVLASNMPQLRTLPEDQRATRLTEANAAVIATLQKSSGDLSQLVRGFKELAAANLQKDNPLFGMFKSPEELAIAAGTAGNVNAATTREQIEAANRGLNDFGDKSDSLPLLKQAGITATTPFMERIARIAPLLQQEAQQQGTTADVVAAKYFPDQRTRSAVLAQIQGGQLGGGYNVLRKAGQEGMGAATAAIGAFAASDTGRRREAEAGIGVAEAERGVKGSAADILRLQAIEQLKREGELDTSSAAMGDFLAGKVGFGLLPANDQWKINTRVQKIIESRTKGAVSGSWAPRGLAGQDEELASMTARAKALGTDVTNPALGATVDPRQGVLIKDAPGASGVFSTPMNAWNAFTGMLGMGVEKRMTGPGAAADPASRTAAAVEDLNKKMGNSAPAPYVTTPPKTPSR